MDHDDETQPDVELPSVEDIEKAAELIGVLLAMVRLPDREGEENVQYALELARFNTWSQLYLFPAQDQATTDLEEMPSATSSPTTSQRLLRT